MEGKRVSAEELKQAWRADFDRLADRLKGSGMRWDRDNAESVMAPASTYHSGLWDTYWKSQRTVA